MNLSNFLLSSLAFVCLLASARGSMKITEIMYAPRLLDGVLEYVELYNSGSTRVALDGFALRKLFTFPVGTNVESQAYVVVARNKTQFLRFYSNVDPNIVYGDFSQSLPNSVFTVTLENEAQKIVEAVTYSDRGQWPPIAGGFGSSLERLCLTSDASEAGNWIASPVPADADKHIEFGGSPGVRNHWQLCPPFKETSNSDIDIKFSEIMHSPIGEDTIEDRHEFIEFWVANDVDMSLFRILSYDGVRFTFPPGTFVRAGQYIVVAKNVTEFQQVYGKIDPNRVAPSYSFDPKNPRLASDAMNEAILFGPYEGELDNNDRVVLLDDNGRVIELIRYYEGLPWPAPIEDKFLTSESPFFGAIDKMKYKGLSLHRYEFSLNLNCPSCLWLAMLPTPFLAKPQFFVDSVDHPPTVLGFELYPRAPEPGKQMRIVVTIADSGGATVRRIDREKPNPVVLQYVVDDPTLVSFLDAPQFAVSMELNSTNPSSFGALAMEFLSVDKKGSLQYAVNIPSSALIVNRIIRWRLCVRLEKTADPWQWPALNEPSQWLRVFVSPEPVSESASWHGFITSKNWGDMIRNMLAKGRDGYESPPGSGNTCGNNLNWNDRFPCFIAVGRTFLPRDAAPRDLYSDDAPESVYELPGAVAPCLLRYQGSKYNRVNGPDLDLAKWRTKFVGPNEPISVFRSWTHLFTFPKYAQLNGRSELLLHKIMTTCTHYSTKLHYDTFTSAGLQAAQVRYDRLFMNGGYIRYAMNVQKWHQNLLKERLIEINDRCLNSPTEKLGHLFKAQGTATFAATATAPAILNAGPFGEGTIIRLPPICGYSEMERFAYTYGRKTFEDYRDTDHQMLIDMAIAFESLQADIAKCYAGDQSGCTAPRKYLADNFDLDYMFSYYAIQAYGNSLDDNVHNYYLYRRTSDNKWILFPWDADVMYERPELDMMSGVRAKPTQPWINRIKDSFLTCYKAEIFTRMKTLMKFDVLSEAGFTRRMNRTIATFNETETTLTMSFYAQNFTACRKTFFDNIPTRQSFARNFAASYQEESVRPDHSCWNTGIVKRKYSTYSAPPARPVSLKVENINPDKSELVLSWGTPSYLTGNLSQATPVWQFEAQYRRDESGEVWKPITLLNTGATQQTINLPTSEFFDTKMLFRVRGSTMNMTGPWSFVVATVLPMSTTTTTTTTTLDAIGDSTPDASNSNALIGGDSDVAIIAGGVTAAIVGLLLVGLALFLVRNKNKKQSFDAIQSPSDSIGLVATNGFSQFNSAIVDSAETASFHNSNTAGFNAAFNNYNNDGVDGGFVPQQSMYSDRSTQVTMRSALPRPIAAIGAGVKAVVVNAYVAVQPQEVSLSLGEIVTVNEQDHSAAYWHVSTSSGASGYAPSSALKIGFVCDICSKAYELEIDLQTHRQFRHGL